MLVEFSFDGLEKLIFKQENVDEYNF